MLSVQKGQIAVKDLVRVQCIAGKAVALVEQGVDHVVDVAEPVPEEKAVFEVEIVVVAVEIPLDLLVGQLRLE